MAERIKDAQDRRLESMFESEPLMDDGFSINIVRKLNRRLWARRLVLPVAASIGGAVAFKPLAGFVKTLSSFTALIPSDFLSATSGSIPQLSTVIMGAVLLAVCLFAAQALQE